LSGTFLSEYAMWLFAPYPFLLPWLLIRYFSLPAIPVDDALFRMLHHDWSGDSFAHMLLANTLVWVSSYSLAFAVFHLARYTRAANFKFNPGVPPLRMIVSEVFRSFGGVVVLTAYQAVFLTQHYRGLVISPPVPTELVVWSAVIALYSDLHFYAIHRAMHAVPVLYRWVHKVHHKSINTDPWSGLSMHPVEHLLYFSALLLCLLPIPGGVPFFVTNTLRLSLLIYPIPAHIGYWPFEKHHWEHHTQFNYNYGSSMLWDVVCGTTYEEFSHLRQRSNAQNLGQKARAAAAKQQQELAMGD